ncbi:hypothetical protein ACFVYP_06895 [Kitasatospora sp. NPDC058201]|uniref:hypothetical protein n=1 Tax=unclassified Kitasatospora TaxID=2633591 RepID=UPI00365770E8
MIPAAAAQTIRTAAYEAVHLGLDHPDTLAAHITDALIDAGWQITPDPVTDPDDIPPSPTADSCQES